MSFIFDNKKNTCSFAKELYYNSITKAKEITYHKYADQKQGFSGIKTPPFFAVFLKSWILWQLKTKKTLWFIIDSYRIWNKIRTPVSHPTLKPPKTQNSREMQSRPIARRSLADSDTGLPNKVGIISHNLWLIPIPIAAWPLGRKTRCAANLSQAAHDTVIAAGDKSLVIVAAQEAWAFRTGFLWILVYIWSKFEAVLLSIGYAGAHEPLWNRVPKTLVLIVVIFQSWVTMWLPFMGRVVWDPKLELASTLRSSGAMPWSTSGVRALSMSVPWSWPPIWLDSGLFLSASQPPDESGFIAYERKGGPVDMVLMGMLWGRWGSLGIVNTHMTFENSDGGIVRRGQQLKLTCIIAALLGKRDDAITFFGASMESLFLTDLCGSSDGKCSTVILVGDLNHSLPEQTTCDVIGEAPSGMDREPSRYTKPWVPAHASLDGLINNLKLGGQLRARRVSGDEPTNEDGTVDHVIMVTPSSEMSPYECVIDPSFIKTVPDIHADISDHLLIKTILQRTEGNRSYNGM